MTDLYKWFVDFMADCWDFFDTVTVFEFFGFNISLSGIFIAIVFVALGFSIFWRGGRY